MVRNILYWNEMGRRDRDTCGFSLEKRNTGDILVHYTFMPFKISCKQPVVFLNNLIHIHPCMQPIASTRGGARASNHKDTLVNQKPEAVMAQQQ